jgi:hypothetical protein
MITGCDPVYARRLDVELQTQRLASGLQIAYSLKELAALVAQRCAERA